MLIWAAGPGWAFVLDATSFALSALLLALIRVRHVPVPRRSIRTDLRHGCGEVRARDWFWTSLLAHGVWNGAAAVLITLGPAVAIQRLGGEDDWVLLLQAGAVGMLAGSLLAGRARLHRPVLVANLGLALLRGAAAPAGRRRARRRGHRRLLPRAGRAGLPQPGLGDRGAGPVPAAGARPGHLVRLADVAGRHADGVRPGPVAAEALGASSPLAVAGLLVALACTGTAAVPAVRRLAWPVGAPPAPAEQVPAGR